MSAVVTAARGWLGTPYRHQAACKGAGADCLGLIRGLWREVYGAAPEAVPAYTPDWGEADGGEALWQAIARHLPQRPLGDPREGDVLLFRMRQGGMAKHLGLQSAVGPEARFIHAYSRHGVIESALTAPWQRRIVARFAFD